MQTLITARTERYAAGKYFVYHENIRIGCIVGSKRSWLAEQGPTFSEYHKSKALAVHAICDHYLKEYIQDL